MVGLEFVMYTILTLNSEICLPLIVEHFNPATQLSGVVLIY